MSADNPDPAAGGGLGEGSILPLGAALLTIVLAVVLGLVAGSILPPAAVIVATPTPIPSDGASPGATGSGGPLPIPIPLPGTLTFGTGLDAETQACTGVTDTFNPGDAFCLSIALLQPFGVSQVGEDVLRIEEDGSQTLIESRDDVVLPVPTDRTIKGYTEAYDTLLRELGAGGTYIIRIYRGSELLAEGTFTLLEASASPSG